MSADTAAEPSEPLIRNLSPLFESLREDDLARAMALAKRTYRPFWDTIRERMALYLPLVRDELEAMGAPLALIAIPIVESGYNPYALSHAGAMGLWQLMPRTARHLGIKKNRILDGRRDVRISTRAAAGYLMSLYRRFGNWPAAIAAYHLGPNAMARRLRGTPWRPADGLDAMPAPRITRAYVRQVLGLAAALDLGALPLPEPVNLARIELEGPVDLMELARHAGVDARTLFRLNPGLNVAQVLGGKIELRVPADKVNAIHDSLPLAGPKTVDYRVRAGDSLWTIARRFRIGLRRLKALNPGVRATLRIGQRLRVPANLLARATPRPNPLLSQGRRIRYRVRAGDSLWTIARRFGTTPASIARANELDPDDILRPGRKLWVVARIRPG